MPRAEPRAASLHVIFSCLYDIIIAARLATSELKTQFSLGKAADMVAQILALQGQRQVRLDIARL